MDESQEIQEFGGKKYKKVYDKNFSDSKEMCIKHCCFCEKDGDGDYCCGLPQRKILYLMDALLEIFIGNFLTEWA